MSKSLQNQVAFNAGEFSPLLAGRIDQQKYQAACRKLKNLIGMKQGGMTRRPGTEFIASAPYISSGANNFAVRLMKFQFSVNTTVMLEFGQQYVRFYSNGEQVVVSTAPTWVTGTYYYAGNYVTDPNTNLIYFAEFNQTSIFPPSTDPGSWRQQTILEVPTPYQANVGAGNPVWSADVFKIVPCQVNDVVYLVHPDYPVQKLVRFSDTNWTLQPSEFNTPALLDQNTTNTTIAASATTGTVSLVASAPAWVTANYYSIGNSALQAGVVYECVFAHTSGTFSDDVSSGYWIVQEVFNSLQIGSEFQLAYLRSSNFVELNLTGDDTSATIEARGEWSVQTYGVWSSDISIERSDDGGQTWNSVRTSSGRSDRNLAIKGTAATLGLYRIVTTNYSAPINPGATIPRVVFEVSDIYLYGLVKILTVSDTYNATAEVVTQLNSTEATRYWSEGAWSDYRGYPQSVTAFQQRIVYGGTQYEPQRIWGTVINDIENFALGDQSLATDSYRYDIAAIGKGPIQWMNAQTSIFIGFSGAEWVVSSGNTSSNSQTSGATITAQAINAVEHSTWGSQPNVPGLIVGDAALYVQRSGKTLRQMLFSVYTTKYMSQDLGTLSEHLFNQGIAQVDYQAQYRNQGILWAVTKANALCGMTYELEQEVFGWHRHFTGDYQPDSITDEGFESVQCIYGEADQDDEVWVVVARNIGGTTRRYIERLNPVNWETQGPSIQGLATPDAMQSFFVDSGLTITSPVSSAIPGFSHLAGRYVTGIVNALPFAPVQVSEAGVVTIPNYEPVSGDVLQIGLPVTYAGQPMRLDIDPRAGATMALQKNISDVYLLLNNTLGGNISNGTPNNMQPDVPILKNAATAQIGVQRSPVSELVRVQPFNTYADDPPYIITGSDALPLTVLALVIKYEIAGTP